MGYDLSGYVMLVVHQISANDRQGFYLLLGREEPWGGLYAFNLRKTV
jgi:hypothetical protein